MNASAVSSSEASSDGPAVAKRPKLESPLDDDEDISIIAERISVRPPQLACGSSQTAEPSQLSADNNLDSKIAEFRNKMLKYEEEASRLRTQLKREQDKTLNVGRDAEVVKRYLEQKCDEERKRANEAEAVAQQKAADAEKKAKDLQKQCERLEAKVQSKEAEIDVRDKQLGNAAKELNEAQKKAENAEKEAAEVRKKATDAEQNEAAANARAAEADAKKEAAEKEASKLKQKLEELKKSKVAAERKLKAKVTELEKRLANTEASEQPSSSTDANGATQGIALQENDITKLHADNNKLKNDLSDAMQLATEANDKAVEADVKKAAAEKEASDLNRKLEELKRNKTDAERKLRANIAELENRLANAEASDQPSSSTDGKLGDGHQENEFTKLQAANNKLKKELSASKAKEKARATSLKGKDDRIQALNEQIEYLRDEIRELKKIAFHEQHLEARLETSRLQQAIGRFDRIADKIMIKCDPGGVSIQSIPSRLTLPKVLLELKPSFFDEYYCCEKSLAQTDCSLLSQGFASQAGKEQCRIEQSYDSAMGIDFKSANEEDYHLALLFDSGDELEWVPIEDNEPYACIFEMNSFVLAQAAQKLSSVLLDFSNHGQPDAVAITDSEVRLSGAERECLWRSLPGDNPHENDFKAEFSSTTPNTHLGIYVGSEYLRRCVMASSGAGKGASKTVEVAMSDDTLRLRYGNEHFTLTYYIPTVKPTEIGERSPIEFEHEVLFS